MTPPEPNNAPEDEFDLIRWIRRQIAPAPNVPVGIGDDAAALGLPPDTATLVTTDMLIDDIHFRFREVAPRRIGRKAVARCLSDIAAMAGDAHAIVVALAAPKHTSVSALQEIIRGMIDAAHEFNVHIVGGDIAVGNLPLTITVTAVGAAKPGHIPLRSAARPNDVLLVTGELGGSRLGRHLDFTPRLAEARWLNEQIDLHAMIDISDGLAADANHIAAESGVGIELWEDSIPISPDAVRAAQSSGAIPLHHALHDGEDYELLFTTTAREAEHLLHRNDLPLRISCIGDIVPETGLWLRKRGQARRPLEPRGWRHLL